MIKEKTLLVTAIKNGTVIDHIAAGNALKIINILNLPDYKRRVTVGLNLPSKSMKIKDLIKVEDRELTEDEASHVAILAPEADINIIRNYKVTKKFKVTIPKEIVKVMVCPNPKCITNNEPMNTRFKVDPNDNKDVLLQCAYCEKNFNQNEIRSYNL